MYVTDRGMQVVDEVSSTIEEYLEAIYRLQESNGLAKTTELAKQLDVRLGTITNTIESMEKRNLVVHKPYRGVWLTATGRRMALDVVRRHRLSERLLVDILKVDWSKAHKAACKLEHAFSDRELSRLLEKVLGFPRTCPHGNPIPSETGKLTEEKSKVLSSLNTGEKAMIIKVADERREILSYLSKLGVVPYALVEVVEKAPLGGPISIIVGSAKSALGRDVASTIWVRRM